MMRFVTPRFLAKRMMALVIPGAIISCVLILLAYTSATSLHVSADKQLKGLPRTTYDLLIRPESSVSEIEKKYGLVDPNYLDGIAGGITDKQYETIKSLPGVEVAAPIAVLGYVTRNSSAVAILDPLPDGIYKVSAKDTVNDGIKEITANLNDPYFAYFSDQSADPVAVADLLSSAMMESGLAVGKDDLFTGGFILRLPRGNDRSLLVAIDPDQEARLVGLDQKITNGNYLPEETAEKYSPSGTIILPVLFNLHDNIDQKVSINLQKVDYSFAENSSLEDQLRSLPNVETLTSLPLQNTISIEVPIERKWLYAGSYISIKENQIVGITKNSSSIYSSLESPSPVQYRELAATVLSGNTEPIFEVIPQGVTSSTEERPWSYDFYPKEMADYVQRFNWTLTPEIDFRNLTTRFDQKLLFQVDDHKSGSYEMVDPQNVGANVIDPVPLETYYPPTALLKYDEKGQAVQESNTLSPTLNSNGYLVTPPGMLISLSSARLLLQSGCVQPIAQDGKVSAQKEPCDPSGGIISAIRVRVGGITTMDDSAQEKIEYLAQQIYEKTGLHVDIMAGSSAQPVLIHVPAYKNIPGEGYVEEQWIKKGVTTSISSGLSGFQGISFVLLILSAVFFLILLNQIVFTNKISEIGLITSFGWRRKDIFYYLLKESLIACMITFLFAIAASLIYFSLSSIKIDSTIFIFISLIVLSILILSMVLPFRRIMRLDPIRNMTQGEIFAGHSSGRVTSLAQYIFNEIKRKPKRSLVLWLESTVSSFILAYLLLSTQNLLIELDQTQLGKSIVFSIQPQISSTGIALLLLSVATGSLFFFSSLSERKIEIGILKAISWREGAIQTILIYPLLILAGSGFISGAGSAVIVELITGRPLSFSLSFWALLVLICLILPTALLGLISQMMINQEIFHKKAVRKIGHFNIKPLLKGLWKYFLGLFMISGLFFIGWKFFSSSGEFLTFNQKNPISINSSETAVTAANVVQTPQNLSVLPHYTLDLFVDTQKNVITGSENILYINDTGKKLDQIVLRLYPNAPQINDEEGGNKRLKLFSLAVNQRAIPIALSKNDSVLTIELPASLPPSGQVTISLSFTLERYPVTPKTKKIWNEASFFPMLAVYDQNGWREDICNYCGDIVFSQSAFFNYTITLPSSWQIAAAGLEIKTEKVGNDEIKHTFQVGPVRDLAVSFSQYFTQAQANVGTTQIFVETVGDSKAADQILSETKKVFTLFSDRFGNYPYATLRIVGVSSELPAGMEYPGYVSLSYALGDEKFPLVLAHEIAHQWWYGTVGNDIFNEPWLDESIAQYSALMYIDHEYGQSKMNIFLNQFSTYLDNSDFKDWKVGNSVYAFSPKGEGYLETVYYKGPLFLMKVNQIMGEESFLKGIKSYYQQYKYGIATSHGFQVILQQYSTKDLSPLFEEWVYGKDGSNEQ